MRLLINTATTHKGGGVQVAFSFIHECRKFKDNEYHIILGEKLSGLIVEDDFPKNFKFYKIGYRPATRVFSLKSHDSYFKDLEKRIEPDVVFTTSGPSYWRPYASHLTGFNLGHFIYKDSPYFSVIPFYKRIKWDIKGLLLKYFFKKDTDAYVVQTDDVNERLRKWLNTDQVHTVTNTYGNQYQNPKKISSKLPVKQNHEFRFLSLSAWYPHKNLDLIPSVIDVLSENLKNKVQFVLTLPDEDYKKYIPIKYRSHILNVGSVIPDECPGLYSECDALFMPTLIECFSASYAEAMVMEKPIITTDLGFAKSICGDAALYFEPLNQVSAALAIQLLIDDNTLKDKLIMEGKKQLGKFDTPQQRAQKYLKICLDLNNY